MNEHNQVVAFWFTTGTSMAELESSIAKIKHRYKLYDYKGPSFATTDRCCGERSFWRRVFDLDNDATNDTEFLADEDFNQVEVVKPPHIGEIASTVEMSDIFVGWISDELMKLPREQQMIVVDGEWRVGNPKMDLLIICLPYSDYKVYLFQLTRMCNNDAKRFPWALRQLLEDPAIKKVGNRIPCDVAKLVKWDVKMAPIVELGHLMYDRALTPTRAPSLETIIDTLFPSVELEGKHEGADSVRTSDWSTRVLSDPQIEYASADGYATGVSLRAALQVMDPKVQARILAKDAVDGLEVTLYRSKWKGRVAKGTIRGMVGSNKVRVEINLTNRESIYSCGTYVDMLGDRNDVLCQKSLESLLDECENSELDSPLNRVCIQWPLYFCRRTINMSGSDDPIL
jgi:hypothetical protein